MSWPGCSRVASALYCSGRYHSEQRRAGSARATHESGIIVQCRGHELQHVAQCRGRELRHVAQCRGCEFGIIASAGGTPGCRALHRLCQQNRYSWRQGKLSVGVLSVDVGINGSEGLDSSNSCVQVSIIPFAKEPTSGKQAEGGRLSCAV